MHRLVVMYPQPKDPAHFKQHYENVHIVLGREVPDVRRLHYSFDVKGIPGDDGMGGDSDLGLFCVFMADWDTEEAMISALMSPAGQAVLRDVQNYATGGSFRFHYELDEPTGP
jgi:uncharacterized protein (TIGR02118 family)